MIVAENLHDSWESLDSGGELGSARYRRTGRSLVDLGRGLWWCLWCGWGGRPLWLFFDNYNLDRVDCFRVVAWDVGLDTFIGHSLELYDPLASTAGAASTGASVIFRRIRLLGR